MNKILSSIISLAFVSVFYGQKAITFDKINELGLSISELDSSYQSGIHSDSTLAVFRTNQQEYISSYQELLQALGKYLKKNGFNWAAPTKGFNRIYFDKSGRIDYFVYSFRPGQLTPEQEEQFQKLLQQFIREYQFKLSADKNFAQCSPVTYTPPAEEK